jgi:hypothetical protein
MVLRPNELDAHDRSFYPADYKKEQCKEDVQDTQPLVIYGCYPGVKPINERARRLFRRGQND